MANIPKYFYFRVNPTKAGILLEDASDADVVEVVRCKDCTYYEPDEVKGFCTVMNVYFDKGGYCSIGRQKDGEQNE